MNNFCQIRLGEHWIELRDCSELQITGLDNFSDVWIKTSNSTQNSTRFLAVGFTLVDRRPRLMCFFCIWGTKEYDFCFGVVGLEKILCHPTLILWRESTAAARFLRSLGLRGRYICVLSA